MSTDTQSTSNNRHQRLAVALGVFSAFSPAIGGIGIPVLAEFLTGSRPGEVPSPANEIFGTAAGIVVISMPFTAAAAIMLGCQLTLVQFLWEIVKFVWELLLALLSVPLAILKVIGSSSDSYESTSDKFKWTESTPTKTTSEVQRETGSYR